MRELKGNVRIEPAGGKGIEQPAVFVGDGDGLGALADALAKQGSGDGKSLRVGAPRRIQELIGALAGNEAPRPQLHSVARHDAPNGRAVGGYEDAGA